MLMRSFRQINLVHQASRLSYISRNVERMNENPNRLPARQINFDRMEVHSHFQSEIMIYLCAAFVSRFFQRKKILNRTTRKPLWCNLGPTFVFFKLLENVVQTCLKGKSVGTLCGGENNLISSLRSMCFFATAHSDGRRNARFA